MQREYIKVLIGRLDGDDTPNYEVLGLPEGAGFKDRENYERHTASWLKINGYGFACDGAEISEHGETVTIQQDTPGGSLRIQT